MNPLDNNGKTDIFWRDIQEDDSLFLESNAKRSILFLSDVCNRVFAARITRAQYVDLSGYYDSFSGEKVAFYAFLT